MEVLAGEQKAVGVDKTSVNTALSGLVDAWRAFDLDSKRNDLDAQANEIGNNKEASVKARKTLAKQTQDFRKASNDEKLEIIAGVVKSYQDEIDKLTKRSKFAESSFLTVYKLLGEVQDPVPMLTTALEQSSRLQRMTDLELENKQLQRQLLDFRGEFREIQNQEVTIRRLEDKLKDYDTHLEGLVEERVASSARKLRDENQQQMDMLRDREQELLKQVAQSHEELARTRRGHDQIQSQLLELQVRFGEDLASKQSEVDMLVSELERTSTLVATLEKERVQPKQDVTPIQPYLELELAQKELEISRLNELLETLSASHNSEKEKLLSDVDHLKLQLKDENSRYESLTRSQQVGPSSQEHDALQKEIEILKAMVYGSEAESESSNRTSVDQVLKDKNRHLENELLRLRLTLSERESAVAALQQEVSQLAAKTTEQKALIVRLEDDVTKGGSLALSASTDAAPNLLEPETVTVAAGPPDRMLEIVSGQRDRFKARLAEIELNADRTSKQLDASKSEIASLRADNVKLYEKIRYLQSYETIAQNRREKGVDLERGHKDDLDRRYGALYEEEINPFVIFNRKEKDKRYQGLSAAERVILQGGRIFLANKYTRLFLFVYSLLLHALVMGTLYKWSLMSPTVCAVPLNAGNL